MKSIQTGLSPAKNSKGKLIQLIHIAKSKLHLDDDTYRANLKQLTGKDSTKAMTHTEIQTVFDDLKTKGFKTAPAKNTKLKRESSLADDDQSKLIRHLWLSLHSLGEVRDPSETALANYVKRQTGVQFLQWLKMEQASTVIESLKQWQMQILKARAQAFLKAFDEPRLNSFSFTPELLNWVHQTARGKSRTLDDENYATFNQAYQSLTTKSPQ